MKIKLSLKWILKSKENLIKVKFRLENDPGIVYKKIKLINSKLNKFETNEIDDLKNNSFYCIQPKKKKIFFLGFTTNVKQNSNITMYVFIHGRLLKK